MTDGYSDIEKTWNSDIITLDMYNINVYKNESK